MRIPCAVSIGAFVLSCLTAGCGSNTHGIGTPETDVMVALVSQGLADQQNAARWISPALGGVATYRLTKLSSTRLVPPFQETDEPHRLKIRVVAVGEYTIGANPLPTAPVSVSSPAASQAEATAMGKAAAERAAQPPKITESGSIPFRANFEVYVVQDHQGHWSIQ